jgi:hypothetical protein
MSTANTPKASMTNMPGFTAEASLYSSEGRYMPRHPVGVRGIATITPATRFGSGMCCQRCGWGGDWCCEECLV